MTPAIKNFQLIAGVDEVGVGPLAGPVVAAAVILGPDITRRRGLWREVRDSKMLTDQKRRALVQFIRANALECSIGVADNREVDELNILYASLLSMRRAVEKLKRTPSLILIDGRNKIFLPLEGGGKVGVIEQRAIIDGDQKILAIAAASIIAKVCRDDMMRGYAKDFPDYGFAEHKGYGTALHQDRLRRYGPCQIHRMTFAPVRAIID